MPCNWLALVIVAMLTHCAGIPAHSPSTASRVEKHKFISPENPKLTVVIGTGLRFVGAVPFVVDNVAAGTRYVFVKADRNKHIRQMFIVQQEGFLPNADDTYKYKISTPAVLGGSEYQHSVLILDHDEDIRENPGKEADVTKRFLESHGYELEPGLVMSRFARPADLPHKHEIIFFCFENLSSYGYKLKDFPEGSDSLEKQILKQRADENCHKVFRVIE